MEKVADMYTISTVEEGTFKKSDISLVDQFFEYFRSYNFEFERKYGMISIKKSGIKSSISHGIGREKQYAFAAVSQVLQNGEIVSYVTNYKGWGYNTAIFAAHVSIGNRKYFESCVVKESTTKNAFYLHEVGIIKEGEMPFKTEPMFSGKTPSVRNILH